MSQSHIHNVTILGAGVLGSQIAWHSAFHGKKVVIFDPSRNALKSCRKAHEEYAELYKKDLGAAETDIAATKDRLSFTDSLVDAVASADLVIEAVPELPEIKTKAYTDMAAHLPEHTLIATNSSTFLPSDFAAATGRPENFCALHFANLIWIYNVGEIMAHSKTSPETLEKITHFAIEIGQVPIPAQKEANGYVLNGWFVPLLTAGLALVANGVSTPEDVDRTFMIYNRGCKVGPCGFVDMVGMKTAYDVSAYWGEVNNDQQMKRNAVFIKENFLDKGLQGRMGGEGFYTYPNPSFSEPDFLKVPDSNVVADIVRRATLT